MAKLNVIYHPDVAVLQCNWPDWRQWIPGNRVVFLNLYPLPPGSKQLFSKQLFLHPLHTEEDSSPAQPGGSHHVVRKQ
jgi:hypothetical protein